MRSDRTIKNFTEEDDEQKLIDIIYYVESFNYKSIFVLMLKSKLSS